MTETLAENLFADDGKNSFAVVDGAACGELVDKLAESAPPSVCLFAGELEPDVIEVAPHLVQLSSGEAFTEWLLAKSGGKHWGIFVRSAASLQGMRKHFRTFLMVRDPEGEPLYFRFYDPRVLRLYLPTCEPSELRTVFGPVSAYFSESGSAALTVWTQENGTLDSRQIALAL